MSFTGALPPERLNLARYCLAGKPAEKIALAVKHGAEFGRITKQDYLRQAQLLRDAKPVDPVLEAVRRDGVITRFDRQTGAFIAFNPEPLARPFCLPAGPDLWVLQLDSSGELAPPLALRPGHALRVPGHALVVMKQQLPSSKHIPMC